MADRIKTRSTVSGMYGKYPSRAAGTLTAIQMNTFILDKVRSHITGEELAPILLDAMEPALEQALAEWPVDTGASKSTINTDIMEEGPKSARVALHAGGEDLINHPDNPSKKDYAPYIEFNGTLTAHPGTLTRAMVTNEEEIKERLKKGLAEWLKGAIRG